MLRNFLIEINFLNFYEIFATFKFEKFQVKNGFK